MLLFDTGQSIFPSLFWIFFLSYKKPKSGLDNAIYLSALNHVSSAHNLISTTKQKIGSSEPLYESTLTRVEASLQQLYEVQTTLDRFSGSLSRKQLSVSQPVPSQSFDELARTYRLEKPSLDEVKDIPDTTVEASQDVPSLDQGTPQDQFIRSSSRRNANGGS